MPTHIILLTLAILIKAQDPLGRDVSGDNQIGRVGAEIAQPMTVRRVDSAGLPVRDAAVIFSLIARPAGRAARLPAARLEAETVYTNRDGYASTRMRLGGEPGIYLVAARSGGDIVTFSQTALEQSWVLLMLASLFGGIGLFIFGLNYGGKGLIREAGGRMRDVLFSLTRNRLLDALAGVGAALIMGSSTATAVLLVRFVSNGIIALVPALGILLGADIGTTLVVQLLAFNISDVALLVVGIGVLLRAVFPGFKNWSQFIFGVGVMLFSLKIIGAAASYIKVLPAAVGAIDFLAANPVAGVVAGAVVAFGLHSSAATIGLVIILCYESLLTVPAAVPLLLGANLGTTISSLVASDTFEGRRLALGHILFKLLPILLIFPFLPLAVRTIGLLGGDGPRQVANFHTAYNVLVALIFLPLLDPVAAAIRRVVRKPARDVSRFERLDAAFLTTPAIALGEVAKAIIRLSGVTLSMLEDAIRVFRDRDDPLRKSIIRRDDEIDETQELINRYLARIDHEGLDGGSLHLHAGLLSAAHNLEHIGDIVSKGLMASARKHIDGGLQFSVKGFEQMRDFHAFAVATLRISTGSLAARDANLGREAAARHEEGYRLARQLESEHLARLAAGVKETLETSTIHLDIISDLERINFHASEIGKAVL